MLRLGVIVFVSISTSKPLDCEENKHEVGLFDKQ